jgi:hypothetical protein
VAAVMLSSLIRTFRAETILQTTKESNANSQKTIANSHLPSAGKIVE